MKLTSFFIDAGIPKTGLTPKIDVWKYDGTHVVTNQDMIEIAGGFYYYDFTDYDEDEDYVIRADGTSEVSKENRYLYSSNETAGVGKILKIEKGKWEIRGSQMIFYDNDGTTPIYTFDLKNKHGSATEKDVYSRTPA